MVQIKFNVDDVLPKLNMVANVVNQKSPIPILGDVLMATHQDDNGGVFAVFTASDSESWLSCKAALIESSADITLCLDIKKLRQSLGNLQGKEITMEVDEGERVAKFSHKKGYFSLPYDESEEFPHPSTEQENETSIILDSSVVIDALSATGYATAINETLRPILKGIHFDFTNSYMVAAATDGCKLARYQNDNIHIEEEDGVMKGFTFPSKPSQMLPTILSMASGDIKITFGDSVAIISDNSFKFVTRLLTYKYPPYERVIPQTSSIEFEINREELIEALTRVIPLGNESSQYVAFILESYKVTLSTENVEFSTNAKEEVDCNYMGEGLTIGFKGSFLMQTLKTLECETLKVFMQDKTRCGLFVPSQEEDGLHRLGLLLPMA
jgi:DNA polymerase-3 subunit beta